MTRGKWIRAIAAVVLLAGTSLPICAQAPKPAWPVPVDPASSTTGSIDEDNLLILQLTGRAPLIQTAIRELTLRELDTLASFEQRPGSGSRARRFDLARLDVSLWYNAQRPDAEVVGPVWAGRGLTGSIAGGFVTRFGPVSIALRPIAFWTQNQSVDPPPGLPGSALPFANTVEPTRIDAPFRFGARSYARLDPGESWVQVDTRWIAAGVSTATQAWGPMHIYPLLLGPNAGGFPHILAGTGLPWNVGIGRVSARMAVGRLDPSAFAPAHPGDSRRLASELVGVFTPRGLDGLEIGAGRFFHRRWPLDGIDAGALTSPFEGFLKHSLSEKDELGTPVDNQLASAFFRIVRPASGVELYGEFLRDDHSLDINDFAGEPDHSSAFGLGFRKAWQTSSGSVRTLTLETANGRISHLVRRREEALIYTHFTLVEGHTERGQILGSPAVFGGAGYAAGWTTRSATAGWSVMARSENTAQNHEGGTWDGQPVGVHSLEVSRLWIRGTTELTAGAREQLAWNARSGGNNLTLSFEIRPRAPRAPSRP